MYTILLNNQKHLIVSQSETIYQHDSLMDTLQFLIPQTYKDHNLKTFDVHVQYVTPANIVVTEELKRSEELYKDHLEYKLPVNSKITLFAGEVKHISLTFSKTVENPDDENKPIRYIMHTSEISLTVHPSTDYRSYNITLNGSGGMADAESIEKAKQEAIDISKSYAEQLLTIVEF